MIHLNLVREGQGPVVVLSHALGCDLHMWDGLAPLLARDFTVLRYDHRNHGRSDVVAGVTLAAYVLPVALAYGTLAGLPPQAGLYSCMLAGFAFALFCTARHTAVAVTSAISLLLASTLAGLAQGDPERYWSLASTTALLVAAIGVVAAVGGVSSLFGALLTTRLTGRFGVGRVLLVAMLVGMLGSYFIPLAPVAAPLMAMIFLIGQQLVTDPAMTAFDITDTSLRQSIVHDRQLGRVNATVRVAVLIAQLAVTLQGVLSQTLLKRKEGGRCLALEVMVATPAIRNLIREAKIFQIPSAMQQGVKDGMQTLEAHLAQLIKTNVIDEEAGMAAANDPNGLRQLLGKA